MSTARTIHGVFHGDDLHWVGDGFRVSNYFPSGNDLGRRVSPFLLMDYHPPHHYPASNGTPRGVGTHPHRGFETVSLAFEGAVAHRDSSGGGGVIGPGDVQWMTAASGILHNEFHEENYRRAGGTMHMMQLWVNLPRANKMDPPRYQALTARDIPRVSLPSDGGEVRVVAGAFGGTKGAAQTFTPINLWDVRMEARGRLEASFPANENLAVLVLRGEATFQGSTKGSAGDLVVFENTGNDLAIEARSDAHLLVLNGMPIDEPVVFYGPFVMTSAREIQQAITDYNAGNFGRMRS